MENFFELTEQLAKAALVAMVVGMFIIMCEQRKDWRYVCLVGATDTRGATMLLEFPTKQSDCDGSTIYKVHSSTCSRRTAST